MIKIAPHKSETALLEPFASLGLENIVVPKTKDECLAAAQAIMEAGVVGFDTESKPVFLKETINDGPHVVQFATAQKAYIFQLCHQECIPYVRQILQSEAILKVGFGLKSDRGQLRSRLNVEVKAILDMVAVFRKMGYPGETGLRSAVGIVFNQKFHKSKKTTTSNWGFRVLNEKQLIYAANDAYVALMVLNGLNLPREEWPITYEGGAWCPRHESNGLPLDLNRDAAH